MRNTFSSIITSGFSRTSISSPVKKLQAQHGLARAGSPGKKGHGPFGNPSVQYYVQAGNVGGRFGFSPPLVRRAGSTWITHGFHPHVRPAQEPVPEGSPAKAGQGHKSVFLFGLARMASSLQGIRWKGRRPGVPNAVCFIEYHGCFPSEKIIFSAGMD